ncbi:hypothetical protein HYV87_00875 [Candidatus Woesearchaeota archaeon]|nr:hypothetical protein [Candidatus Woesearchaeota archaeon]MBI2581667.1 hypothetical protein [Candidatus Woesearchaeota archaeon]
MNEPERSNQSLGKERFFLFLSILVTAVFLTSSPESLLVFFKGTFGGITGASVAVEEVGMKDYVIGLLIFMSLVALVFYAVHVLRNPRPQRWQVEIPEVSEEETKNITPLKGKYSLENQLDQINDEIKGLRKRKDLPKKRTAKKLTRFANVHEDVLRNELRKITAKLQGFRKPLVLESAPSKWDEDLERVKKRLDNVEKMRITRAKMSKKVPSKRHIALTVEAKQIQQKWEHETKRKPIVVSYSEKDVTLNKDLERIRKELASVDKMKLTRAKIRETTPSIREIGEALERRKLNQELEKVSSMLDKGKKNSSYFIRRYIPSFRERDLEKIKKRLQKKGYLPPKELARIERKLRELKGNQK